VASEVSVVYRFALAAALLAMWCAVTGRSLRFPLSTHCYLAALGATLFGFNYIGVYWAEEHLTSGLVAVIFSTIVFMSPIGMRIFFGTALSPRTFVAAALGVTGVTLLFLPDLVSASRGGSAAYGVACALGATLIATGGNLVAVRNHKAGVPILPGTVWGMGYGAATAAVAAIFHGATWTFDTRVSYLLSLAYLSLFGSVMAFGAYLTLLKRVGAGPSAFVSVATPVVALTLSTLFEGYRWTPIAGAGVVLAIIGNSLALRRPGTEAAK
jgi:drug/metabolite transporter (DMT)-like permease